MRVLDKLTTIAALMRFLDSLIQSPNLLTGVTETLGLGGVHESDKSKLPSSNLADQAVLRFDEG